MTNEQSSSPGSLPRPLRGIVPPMVTPLTSRSELDRAGLERLIEHILGGGVSGLFVLGTTGEAPSLEYRLRYELVETTCELVAGRVPVLVGPIAIGGAFVASAPFWGPAKLIGDDFNSAGYFPRYPYKDPLDGYMMIDPYLPIKPREWAGRFGLGYGENFDEISLIDGRLMLETTTRFGIDTQTRFFAQRLAPGQHDDLWIGDINANFRFAQSTNFQMRVGVGANWLSDDDGSSAGFNLTYGADWFPVDPWVISADLDWGQLGHASLFHVQMTAGMTWRGCEVFAGYDYLDIGYSQYNNVIAGLRFWF